MMTGEHEWNGVREQIDPDPYGRWIVFANYLTRVPGFEHMGRVADAAHELARYAGEDGRPSWDAAYDPLKRSLRDGLNAEEQALWDVVSPPAGVAPARNPLTERLSRELTAAALGIDPGLDPSAALPRIRARVVLSHGVEDRLIPYTESLRLHALLAPVTDASLTLTRLFVHSEHAGGGALHYVREGWKFARLLNRALSSV
jgi:pimeloyl-ACP methyl ester carboxylesterase